MNADVKLAVETVATVLDLLTAADRQRVFGGCDDNLDERNRCRVCEAISDLQTAVSSVPTKCDCCGGAARGGGRCHDCATNRHLDCAVGPLAPGAAGDKVWGLFHRALVHRADHNGPGVTRHGDVIVTVITAPETYHCPDPEPWWEPADRVPLDPGVYLTWPDPRHRQGGESERYETAEEAEARLTELGVAA